MESGVGKSGMGKQSNSEHSSSTHIPCLRCEGRHESCKNCRIYQQGFCDKYCTFLKKNYKGKLFSWVENDQVSDILSELYKRVLIQAPNLTTTTGGQYFRLFDKILRGVIYDHIFKGKNQVNIPRELRKTPKIYCPISIDDEDARHSLESEKDHDVDDKIKRRDAWNDVERVLVKLIDSNDSEDHQKKECARLILDWRLKKRADKTDEVIAREYGMSLDTYKQKKKKCLSIISAEVKIEMLLVKLIDPNDSIDHQKKECARLILDWRIKKRAGKIDNVIAKEYGMSLDIYESKKKECLEIISAEVKNKI